MSNAGGGYIEFSARDGALYASNSLRTDRFDIKGVNWFGAEGKGACPDGLWQRPAVDFLDFARSHGFNALRLPLAADNVLADPTVDKWSVTADTSLHGLRSLQVVERLVRLAARRGLLVMLDMHRLHAAVWPTAHGLWYDPEGSPAAPMASATPRAEAAARGGGGGETDERGNEQASSGRQSSRRARASAAEPSPRTLLPLEEAWRKLARRFCSHWNVFAADLFNEPWGASWGSNEPAHDWARYAARLGDLILAECPRWLVVIEGVGTGGPTVQPADHTFCDLCFWGENFQGLGRGRGVGVVPQLSVPNRVVFSPHLYGPATNGRMFYFNRTAFPEYPANLPAVWRQHFLDPARAAGATLVIGEVRAYTHTHTHTHTNAGGARSYT